MTPFEYGPLQPEHFSRDFLLSRLLFIVDFRRPTIEQYTNQLNFSLADAFLAQSIYRGEIWQIFCRVGPNHGAFSYVTKGGIEHSHNSPLGHLVDW